MKFIKPAQDGGKELTRAFVERLGQLVRRRRPPDPWHPWNPEYEAGSVQDDQAIGRQPLPIDFQVFDQASAIVSATLWITEGVDLDNETFAEPELGQEIDSD